MENLLRRLLKMTRAAIPNTVRAMVIISTTATIPPMMAEVELEEEDVVAWSAKHCFSLRDVMATEHSASTVSSIPVTMIVAPPLTQLSSREMREPLSLSELPPSLVRNVTCVGDSVKQANDCLLMLSLPIPHSAQETVSSSSTALVMSSNFLIFSVVCKKLLLLHSPTRIMIIIIMRGP